MNSLILRTATKFLFPLMLLFSIFLLLRGHNEPGGGFSGGLVAAGAFALYAIAFDVRDARRALRVDPRVWVGAGLLLAAGSGIIGWLIEGSFLEGAWWTTLEFEPDIKVSLGTPLLFDVGVFLAVLGSSLMMFLTLLEE